MVICKRAWDLLWHHVSGTHSFLRDLLRARVASSPALGAPSALRERGRQGSWDQVTGGQEGEPGRAAPGKAGLQRLRRHLWKLRGQWAWNRRAKVAGPSHGQRTTGGGIEERLRGSGGAVELECREGAGAKTAQNQRKHDCVSVRVRHPGKKSVETLGNSSPTEQRRSPSANQYCSEEASCRLAHSLQFYPK